MRVQLHTRFLFFPYLQLLSKIHTGATVVGSCSLREKIKKTKTSQGSDLVKLRLIHLCNDNADTGLYTEGEGRRPGISLLQPESPPPQNFGN